MRLSPTCATSAPAACARIATTVEPGRSPLSAVGIAKTRRFASSIATLSASFGFVTSGAPSTTSRIVLTASSAASLPPAWPPMPSQTTAR